MACAATYTHPEAAAEVDLGAVVAELGGDLGVQPNEPSCTELEAAGVEDLAADVRVQPAQVEAVVGEDLACGVERLTCRKAEAELLVLVAGRDELVCVRLDPDGHADHHRCDDAERGRDPATRSTR